ncbi:hypothetical protein LCGC14_2342930 [marine sediment metagenome]|uniref:Uncharacterized protein n=1 Tax=marine sediment metagenome TaxID=412755 RepID=A0A0F9EP48_9ZZZZ
MNDLERVYEAGARIGGTKLYASEALQLWRQHADTEHSASKSTYRRNVVGWHRRSHPDCEWDIGIGYFNGGGRPVMAGTDGIHRCFI